MFVKNAEQYQDDTDHLLAAKESLKKYRGDGKSGALPGTDGLLLEVIAESLLSIAESFFHRVEGERARK